MLPLRTDLLLASALCALQATVTTYTGWSFWLANLANLVIVAEAITLAFGVFQLWVGRSERKAAEERAALLARKSANYEAWQVINSAQGKGGSGGRIDALHELASNGVSLAGVCLDVACKGVTCPPDQTCHAGHCGVACDGIVCPHGITCRDGACVDPCAGKSCGGGQVCVGGLCLPGCTACGGVSCSAPLACDATSGACVDPSCPMGCPAGQYCDSGACKDACDGAICPPKHQCVMGQCVPSSMTNGAGGNGGGGGGGCGCAAPARQRGGTTGAFFLVVLFGLGARRLRHMM